MLAVRTAATLIVLILTAAPAGHAQMPPPPKASVGRNPAADADLLTTGVWTDRLTVASAYANPLLDGLVYRRGGRPIPVSDALEVYGALQRTPLVSLYASSNWHDDVAELVAWHHLTSRMGQPYRIVVRERDQEVLVYEPMASPLVQRRLRLLTPMYNAPPVSKDGLAGQGSTSPTVTRSEFLGDIRASPGCLHDGGVFVRTGVDGSEGI